MARPEPRCPVRGEPCSLCLPGATGPADCGLVYLLRDDDPWDATEGADTAPQEDAHEGGSPSPAQRADPDREPGGHGPRWSSGH